MALADSRLQRVVTLCILYFAQGVPYGFMTITMANYLSGEGLSTDRVGALTAVALLPWTFKIIWAPVIDSIQFKGYGRRRPWIVIAQLFMALTLLGIYFLEPYLVGEHMISRSPRTISYGSSLFIMSLSYYRMSSRMHLLRYSAGVGTRGG